MEILLNFSESEGSSQQLSELLPSSSSSSGSSRRSFFTTTAQLNAGLLSQEAEHGEEDVDEEEDEEEDDDDEELECRSCRLSSSKQYESTSTFQPAIGPGVANRSHGVSRSAGSFLKVVCSFGSSFRYRSIS